VSALPYHSERLDRHWRDFIASQCSESRTGATVKVWNTLKTTYKVSDFIGWQRDKSLILNPNFQRRSVWKVKAKSYLIDTIIKGLPIPIIFLRDKTSSLETFSPLRDVVDGQQRLRTVIAFIAPGTLPDIDPERDMFKISKSHDKELAGKTFKELPSDIKTRILDYQFPVNVFPSDTDDREIYQIFARMNSSGYKLNQQELRNAVYFGEFKICVQTLATEQLNRWRDWKIFDSDKIARMNEVELSSELIIMMLNGVTEKSERVISGAYKKYDDDDSFTEIKDVMKRYRAMFDIMDSHFSKEIPKVFFKRTLFYALFCAVYKKIYRYGADWSLSLGRDTPRHLSPATVNAIIQAGRKISRKTATQHVIDASTKATTHVKERTEVIDYLLHET
jgi:Protein of unknown function DUF262